MTKRTAAIVGVHNTRQGRRLDGETSRGLALKAIRGALGDAGLSLDDVDGISAGPHVHHADLRPAHRPGLAGPGLSGSA